VSAVSAVIPISNPIILIPTRLAATRLRTDRDAAGAPLPDSGEAVA